MARALDRVRRATGAPAVVAATTVGLAVAGCGEYPCTWDTTGDPRDRERVIPTQPGASLECPGAPPEGIPQIGAWYAGGVTGRSSDPTTATLSVRIRAGRAAVDLSFPGDLADGTYLLEDVLDAEGRLAPPRTPPKVWASRPLVVGSFAFARSRDVPFIDVKEPEERVYESTIDVTFDLVITDLEGPANMHVRGCAARTGVQSARLVKTGPVTMCERSILNAFRGGH
jgi:hypothetical protein